jgi:hypothetical protein
MFKLLTNKKAQSVMGEYVLTFFIVVSFMTAMTIYLKRALQSYVRGGKVEMGSIVSSRTMGRYNGMTITEYEPYYLNSVAVVDRSLSSSESLAPSPGFSTGVFTKVFDESSTTQSKSETLPPLLAD